MLDNLYRKIGDHYQKDALFMGLAFKFEKGIAIVDKHTDDEFGEGFIVEWVSFNEVSYPFSVICKDLNEVFIILQEVAL